MPTPFATAAKHQGEVAEDSVNCEDAQARSTLIVSGPQPLLFCGDFPTASLGLTTYSGQHILEPSVKACLVMFLVVSCVPVTFPLK